VYDAAVVLGQNLGNLHEGQMARVQQP
jgi:hypothetical protein